MFLMYVDESGDCGRADSPTDYFALTGLVIHELRWRPYLDQLIDFRRRMRDKFGLRLREEIHAPAMISRPGDLVRIPRNDRLTILRAFTEELAQMAELNVINVLVDKRAKAESYDPFEAAWTALIQRFENTIQHHNFHGPANPDERGMIFADHTDDKKLAELLRRMRRYNPIPNRRDIGEGYRNITLANIIEDPSYRDSAVSYFVQAADLCAFLLYQYVCPNAYIKKKSGHGYFPRLEPVLCRVASPGDPHGIVRL